MFLSVKELELKKIRFDVVFPPGEIQYEEGLRQATPLAVEGSAELLANTLGEIRIRGHLNVRMAAECDRCLEPAQFPVDSNFDLFYRPAVRAEYDEEVEIDEGESEIAFYEGGGIDLKDILREYILLSMPMQRICGADCHGICPVCGQNRNVVNCGCEARMVDDRWAALKNLQTKGTEMPNPKRRHSKRRTSTRRAHDSLRSPGMAECPNCHEPKLPHRACPHCGRYKGREVIEVAEE